MKKDKICIALVDDDEALARALGRLLRVSGFDVFTYASAEAFLVPTPLPPPDCLLLDIGLNGMSGLDLQRHLVSNGFKTPVIFLTASDETDARNEASMVGCAAYLLKPVNAPELLDAVEKAVVPSGKPIPPRSAITEASESFL